MKKLTAILVLVFILYPPTVGLWAQAAKAPLAGVWKYEREGLEGIAIFSPTHFIWVLSATNRQKFTSATPTVAEKARAYEALNAAAGTWELESGSRAKSSFQFASDPNRLGNFVRYDFEISGDEFTYWIIQPDGSRGYSGKYRKLSDWGAPGDITMFQGVWEYAGQNGIYLQAGNYGAWFIRNGTQPVASTDEGKAQNFDAVNCAAAIGTRLGSNHHVWNILHSKDARNERSAVFTGYDMTNSDSFSMWFVDPKRVQVGEKWQIKRIER